MKAAHHVRWLLLCGCAVPSCAQTPDLQTLLNHGAEQAAALATTLPSFACKRTGISELLRASDRSVKKHVPFTGDVRALRNGGSLQEKINYTSVNGKPSTKQGDAPYDVYESFTGALRYLAADEQSCYDYTLGAGDDTKLHVDFTARKPYRRSCDNVPGTQGFALFDVEGHVVHVERTVPEALAAEADLVPYASVDLAPVELDGKTYWLVSRLQSERQDGKEIRRVDVSYTECKLFHADVKLLPDEEVVQGDAAKP